MGGPVLDSHTEELSKFDILVLPEENQVYNVPFSKTVNSIQNHSSRVRCNRKLNDKFWTDPLHQSMYPHIKPEWWLTDANGNQRSVWPNTAPLI